MLQLKFKAAQQSGKGQVIQFPRDRITDWRKKGPGEGKVSELQSGIMKATESKPTVVKTEAQIKSKLEAGNKAAVQKMKIDKLRKDVLKEIENRKNEDYIGNIIDPEDYGFRVSDGTLTDEVEEIMEMLIRDKKAYGGLAGMLGERTGYESGRRAGQTARQKRKASPTDWYTDKIIADNLGRIKSDMFLKYILPERSKRFLENITEDETYGTYDEDSGYSGIVRGDFITKDGKRIEFPAPADKGLDVEGLLEVLDKHDEGSVSKDHNVNKHLKKVIELKGGGLAPLLGEPTYTDENHRVPFSKGKFGEWTAKGLAALIEKLFPGTTKLGQTSRPMAPKTELKRSIAGFQEREQERATVAKTLEAMSKAESKMAGPIKTKNKGLWDPESTDATTWLQQEKFFDPKALDMYGKKVPSNWIAKEKKDAQKLIDDLGPLDVSPNHPNYKDMKAIRQSAKDRLESIKITEALGGNIQMHDWIRMNRKNIKFSDYVKKKGDPVVKDELSGIKKAFVQQKLTPADELRKEFPGISDDLINKILTDDNPQRIAEVKATMKEALKMQEKGMGVEEIINIFKKKPTKHASGGVAGMLGE